MNDTTPASSLFTCSTCGRSFARREHLKRHTRIHTREKPFSCENCGKDFSRLDALNRHVSSHENRNATPVAVVSMRACEHCAVSRARCSRQQPCKRCSDRSIACVYPETKKKVDSVASPTQVRPRASETYTDQDGHHQPPQNDGSNVHQFQLGHPGVQTQDQSSNWAPQLDTVVGSVQQPSNVVGEYAPGPSGLSNINWMSPQGFPAATDWGSQMADFLKQGHVSDPYNTPFPSLPATEIPNDFYSDPFNSGRDASATTNTTLGPYYPTPNANQLSYAQSQSSDNTSKSSNTTSTTATTEGKWYADGTGYRAAFGGRSKKRYSIANVDVLQPDDDDAIAPSSSPTSHDTTLYSAYTAMVHGVTWEHRLYPGQGAEHLPIPTFTQIQFFVQQYFEHFHSAFPFLRKSSFSQDASLDWTLLLAVAATGSRYARHVRGPIISEFLLDALHKTLRRNRYGLGNDRNGAAPFAPGRPRRTDTARPRIQTLQAGVLAVMCMLHCGIKTHLDLALVDRHYLVEACSSLGLLSPLPPGVAFSQHVAPEEISAWAQTQAEIRTGMMIWIVDTIICYEFDARPSMRLSDVQCPLPVDETTWEQSHNDSQAKVAHTVTLEGAMDMLYVEKRIPPNLGELSTCVLLHAIYRKTLEVIAWDQTPLNFWTPTASPMPRPKPNSDEGWLPHNPMVSRWRNSACDCFDILHWSANGKVANLSGTEHHNVLLLHLSRLILLAPTSHILTLATATPARSAAENQGSSTDHAVSRDQVLQWVVGDQYKARLCAIHCGALFWHVRRYSCDSIIEPYGIYISTLILWAFSISSHFVGQDAIDNYANGETTDPPSAGGSASKKDEDESVPSFLHLDRPLDDELVQIFVRVGHKMSAFISGIGNIMDPVAPEKILREGIRLLDRSGREGEGGGFNEHHGKPERDKCYTWGVEGPYIESLRQMAQASARQTGSIR